jgi:hypothetical protein
MGLPIIAGVTSVLRVARVPAIALLGLVLLAGCGTGFQPPAAVVSGHKISQAELQRQIDARLQAPGLRAQVSSPGGEQSAKGLTRAVLAFLIERQVILDYSGANGITVSPSEVNQTLNQTIAQSGGEQAFQQTLRAQNATLAVVRQSIELNLYVEKIQARLSLQQTQAFLDWFRARIRGAHVVVNPRFGRFDVTNLRVDAITSTEG